MKHGIIYLLLTLGVVLTGSLPFTSHDVGELRPVKTVLVRVEGNQVSLETDMGDAGTGNSWDAAMADLKAKAPGTVFFWNGQLSAAGGKRPGSAVGAASGKGAESGLRPVPGSGGGGFGGGRFLF